MEATAFPCHPEVFLKGPDGCQGLSKREYFATHAQLDDVLMAEDALLEAHTTAGLTELDPLTLRIKARYAVADAMLRIRGES